MTQPKKTRKATPKSAKAAAPLEIAAHRRCPVCHGGQGGYGRAYSSDRGTSYYRCVYHLDENGQRASGGCGHTWSVKVSRKIVLTEHHEVEVTPRGG